MSSSLPTLQASLASLLSDVSEGATAQKKAADLAKIIDNYVTERIAKLTGTTSSGPPGGPLTIPPGNLTSP